MEQLVGLVQLMTMKVVKTSDIISYRQQHEILSQ